MNRDIQLDEIKLAKIIFWLALVGIGIVPNVLIWLIWNP